MSRFLCIVLMFYGFFLTSASGKPVWYKCTAHASSHTGRYTFRIDEEKCAVYWLEIDTQMKIKTCKLPIIEALKPSAMDDLSVIWFDMASKRFYDYLSGVLDRGRCVAVEKPD